MFGFVNGNYDKFVLLRIKNQQKCIKTIKIYPKTDNTKKILPIIYLNDLTLD